MNVEPIIKARFQQFKDSYELGNTKDSSAFEKFVNHAILSGHQPDAFSSDTELLDRICVGGGNDMGMDGIAIKLNGLLISDISEVSDIIAKYRRINVEFIFIQSKTSAEFDSGEFVKFTAGVRDFLSEVQVHPRNSQIENVLKIKKYLFSDDMVVMWDSNPAVRLYYVAMGKWRDSEHITAHSDQFKQEVSKNNTYGECNVHFIDADGLKVICDNNQNTFSKTIEMIDSMPLTEVDGVNNSCIALCYASEYVKLISTDEGVIRKSLFDDNVRDYQGTSGVNEEITKTIEEEPEKFGLLNNGITIVCDEYTQSNRRITLKNPQIVNGCQTSHVIFNMRNHPDSLVKLPLQIKIISTNDLDVTNQVVRGTNRQNIVYDEAFETTKKFHKDLEEFFGAISMDYKKIYYERRSKQFNHDPRIKQTDKVNLKILTQYIIGVFLNKPHMAHRHEVKLLPEFGNRIFLDHQSKLPYYAVSLLFIHSDKILKSNSDIYNTIQSFRPHLLMITRELSCGKVPSLNNEKEIDKYCKKLLIIINDETQLEAKLKEAINVFIQTTQYWTNELGKSPDGRKDVPEFSEILLNRCSPGTTRESDPNNDLLYGKVRKLIYDRNGFQCGFIQSYGDDIFFHSQTNPHIEINSLLDSTVSYKLGSDKFSGKPIAIELKKID